MSRAPHSPSSVLAVAFVAAVLLLPGCAGPDLGGRGPAVERSGSDGGLHYRLRSQVSPARVTLGDRAVWRLTARLSEAARPGAFLRGVTDSSLEIAPMEPPSAFRREGGSHWSASLEVRGFDIGRLPLPRVGLTVTLAGVIDTLVFPPDTLYVDSLTPAMTGSVEPDRGPLPTELRPTDYAVALVGALLAIAGIVAAVWLYRRARRRARSAVVGDAAAPEPPEALFLRSIATLRGEIGSLPRDQFYDRLSLAIRIYTGAVTGVPALDRTTGELERELLAKRFDSDAVGAVGAMLRRSDLAKFARQEDPLAEARESLERAAALAGRFRASGEEPLQASAASGTTG